MMPWSSRQGCQGYRDIYPNILGILEWEVCLLQTNNLLLVWSKMLRILGELSRYSWHPWTYLNVCERERPCESSNLTIRTGTTLYCCCMIHDLECTKFKFFWFNSIKHQMQVLFFFDIGVKVYRLSTKTLWRNDCLTPIHQYWVRSECH